MAGILVVEDDARQRSEIEAAFTKAGHHVDVAPSGNQGLACLKGTRYDLLLTDLMMEEGTGFDVRENAPGLPVVIFSSYAKPENLKTFLVTHLYRIVRKPCKVEDLLGQVEELLGSAR